METEELCKLFSMSQRGAGPWRGRAADLTPPSSINWAQYTLPPSPPPHAASNGQTQIFSYLNCSERLPIMKNNKTTEPAAIQMLLVPGRKTISGTICWGQQRIQSGQTAQSVAAPPRNSSYTYHTACHMKEAREQYENLSTINAFI